MLNKFFSKKEDQVETVKRFLAIDEFNKKLELLGINSFKLQVGDGRGAYLDTVFINSRFKGNSDVENFLTHSILKPHTSANLMSIGFRYAGVIEESEQRSELYELSKYAQ